VFNWGFLLSDASDENVSSIFACAFLCSQLKYWTTLSFLPEAVNFVCQMSKKKVSCMEKKEAIYLASAEMYQKKKFLDLFNGNLRRSKNVSKFDAIFQREFTDCMEKGKLLI
jgi:hypothetical protein